jgi:putative transposase
MMELRHASHCVYKIWYHMVLCVKYRKKLLLDEGKIDYFKNLCSEIGKRYWFEFDALGTDGDHVHICRSSPKICLSRVMQIIKSIKARELFKLYPEIKKHTHQKLIQK